MLSSPVEGSRGVCAAIAAARSGAIGHAHSGSVAPRRQFEQRKSACTSAEPTTRRRSPSGAKTGLIEEFKLTEAAHESSAVVPHVGPCSSTTRVVSEPNITLLLDTSVVAAEVDGDRIVAIVAGLSRRSRSVTGSRRHSSSIARATERWVRRQVRGSCAAGKDGIPSASPWRPEKADTKTMGNSLLFFARKHDRPMPFTPPAWARKFEAADFVSPPDSLVGIRLLVDRMGRRVGHHRRTNRRIRHGLLGVLLGVWDYIKKQWTTSRIGGVGPSILSACSPASARTGASWATHILTQRELEHAEPFADRVAYGGWPMDDHPPGGIDARDLPPVHSDSPRAAVLHTAAVALQRRPEEPVHGGPQPERLPCSPVVNPRHGDLLDPRDRRLARPQRSASKRTAYRGTLPPNASRMARLQQILLRDDQALLGVRNSDDADLARSAQIRASSEDAGRPGEKPSIDGSNRDVGDGATHQWRAAMADGEVWLELAWDEPQTVARVTVDF